MGCQVVDSGPQIMWSIKQIAERDEVSRQAVSKGLAKLISDGHEVPIERDSRGRVSKISVAHYDHHRSFFGNSEKGKLPEPDNDRGDELGGRLSESRDEALRQDAWLSLSRKKIAHEENVGALVRADKYAEALSVAGRVIQHEIGRLHNRADEVALAVSKEGERGARGTLRKIAADLGNKIADVLAEIADKAPEHDVMDEEEAS